jgi:hypothetical protein
MSIVYSIKTEFKKLMETAHGDPNSNANANRLLSFQPTQIIPVITFLIQRPFYHLGMLSLSLPFFLAFSDATSDSLICSLLEIHKFSRFVVMG